MFSALMPPSTSSLMSRPAGIDQLAGVLDLAQRRLDEALSAESGIDAHDEHQIDLVDHVFQHLERCRRIEREPGLTAAAADDLQRAIDVSGCFGMKADQIGAGRGEGAGKRVDGLNHQMNVEGHGRPSGRTQWGLSAFATIGPMVRFGT